MMSFIIVNNESDHIRFLKVVQTTLYGFDSFSRYSQLSYLVYISILPNVYPHLIRCISPSYQVYIPILPMVYPHLIRCTSPSYQVYIPILPGVYPHLTRCISLSYQVYIPRVHNTKGILLNDNHGQTPHIPYQSKD